MTLKIFVFLLINVSITTCFLYSGAGSRSSRLFSSIPSDGKTSSWQTTLDELVDIDTPCDTRRDRLASLISQSQDIINDVSGVIGKGDVESGLEVLAPTSTGYGKAIKGFGAFNAQLINDIIPTAFSGGFSSVAKKSVNPSEVIETVTKQAPKLVEQIQELANDPSYLQSTRDDLIREVKNIVKSVPEGLQSPAYTTIASSTTPDMYEIRQYEQFSVCKTEGETRDVVGQGNSFNVLADYIFGEGNVDNYEMSMTTPVIMDEAGSMSFVLADGMTADTAPIPKNMDINLDDIPSEIVAYREFPGIATDAEIAKQKLELMNALSSDGIPYDLESLKVLQFNPPYTLPWLRLNALTLKLTDEYVPPPKTEAPVMVEEEICTATDMPSDVNVETSDVDGNGSSDNDEAIYFSSPEAGE